ncbi:MAG: hypothetical protein OSB03_17120, partial [Vicinamibacterales bacterium]|nr:hypothetical protein [Vicinamibacterales bacterium]
MSVFERLRTGLRRTAEQLVGRLDGLSAGRAAGGTAVDTLDDLAGILLEADIGVSATGRLLQAARD